MRTAGSGQAGAAEKICVNLRPIQTKEKSVSICVNPCPIIIYEQRL